MRGGTSKGVFFNLSDLPESAQVAGEARDALLLRIIGSPDPGGVNKTDGMGGATSSTSKTVIVSKSSKADHDVDYLFGQVAIDKPFVDWSGNRWKSYSAAVGPFAIHSGLVDSNRVPENGVVEVKGGVSEYRENHIVQLRTYRWRWSPRVGWLRTRWRHFPSRWNPSRFRPSRCEWFNVSQQGMLSIS